MRKIYMMLLTVLFAAVSHAQTISATTYPFTNSSGAVLEDMSSGTSFLTGPNIDDGASNINSIGFDFWYVGIRYFQFSASTNGLVRLGGTAVATTFTNAASSYLSGNILPYWDDLWTGTNGKIHFKVVGAAPNRKLVIEWLNEQVPRVGTNTLGAATFQCWLYETTGKIEFVYGNGMAVNTTNAGASIGIANSTTVFANVTVTGPSCAYGVENSTNTAAITSGTKYTFTPLVPADPTALTFSGVTTTGMTLNWADNATNEVGYAIYRSDDGGTTYNFITQTAADAVSSVQTGLGSGYSYFWKVYAVTEGGVSNAVSGSQATTAGTICGTKTVGPTGDYLSLTAAITDIQTNGLSCATILELQSTYLSAVETFPLNFTGLPTSATNTLTVRPQTGAVGLSVTSASATGTINLSGASYVTFDGRPGGAGASQLTISNTTTTGYTVQFINSAMFNTIKYCTVSGVNTATTSGVIFFTTSVGLAFGNSSNTIDNCDIGNGATTPTNLIFSLGTTTTYVTQNNNNTISNCTIHDWFNATSTTSSAAINITGGSSDWTITANSFYQTATRTYTMATATDQGAIHIASTTFGYNFTITNNYIGGTAPLCGGTPLTWTGGATGTPTPRMIRITTSVGAFSNISGNTIANIAVTSSSTSTAHSMIAHLNGNININNNTIGSQSATGNITFILASTSTAPFFLPIGVGTGATPSVINITNNNIGGITVSTSSTGAVSFRVVYGQPAAGSSFTISGNTIGGTIANSIQQLTGTATAGVGSLFGILILNPTIGDIITNNTIRNLTINTPTFAGPSLTGINVQASGGRHTITGNTISNLTTNGLNAAINNAASVVALTMTGQVIGGGNISGNTIHSLTNTNATVAGWINGMYFATSLTPQPNTIIAKNFVHSINLGSSTGGMAGIFFPNTGNGMIYNNMIRLGVDASGASITTPLQINGIYKPSTGFSGVYFNTVYIGGTGVTGAVNTYAYRRSAAILAGTDSVMNNIFWNARSNGAGTGKHYAITLNSTTAILENNNDLFANGAGGNVGNINLVTDYVTLAAWQAGTGLDGASFSADPQLLTPGGTSSTVDLHINAANPTPVEQAGVALAQVTDDFDAQSRAGLTPTDIGADAGNFILLDIVPPSISYTPFAFTCTTGDRTLSGVTIIDATGVPTSGALRPRIYYRKNAGAYFSQPGTLTSGTGNNGTWSFTIVAADMGGLVVGDVVSYYVIAQDLAAPPNIGSNPAGVVATDVNTIITPPSTLNTYPISATLSGTYTVGAGGNYTTLTAAVAAYNTSCLGGPVVFSLIDPTYPSETFPITINANAQASAVNTLTIKPTGTTTISGSSASVIIQINGGDYITIDGSNGSVANTICPPSAATRNLTIQNTNVAGTGVVWLSTTGANDGVSNCTVKNSVIIGASLTATLVGVGVGGATPGSGGVDCDNNRIENNDVRLCRFGIYVVGQNSSNKNQGNVILKNILTSVAPNNIGEGGIFAAYENNITVSGNEIDNIVRTGSPDSYGINLGFGVTGGIGTGTAAIADAIENATITFNKVGIVSNSGTFAAAGVALGNTVTGVQLIANNTISGVAANGTASDFSVGIWLDGGTGTTNVFHNTVSMQGIQPGASSGSQSSVAFGVRALANPLTVNNNIFSNTQIGAAAGTTTRFVAVALGYASPYTGLASNYNDLYSAGAGPGTYHLGLTGGVGSAGTSRPTLAAWQTETGGDAASKNVLPVFVSATDLHLVNTVGTNWCLNGSGTNIPSVTNDIDCQVRNNPPDMGADEFVAVGTGDIATPASQTICTDNAITTIVLSGGAASYSWTRDNTIAVTGIAASGTGNISGTLTNTTSSPVTVTFTISPLNANGCVSPAGTITATVTVNPNATITLTSGAGTDNQTVCINIPITPITYAIGGSGTGGSVSGLPAGVTGTFAGGVITISGTPIVSGTFNYTVLTTGPCVTPTASGTITVTADGTITLTSGAGTDNQTVCINIPITPITYAIGGSGTGGSVSGLPTGVTGSFAGGVITISGTPSVSGTFNYTVSTTGPCVTPTASGTINVTANGTVTLTSAPGTNNQSVCINTPIVNITYTVAGSGTGGSVSGLPTGVSGIFASGVITISGSPSVIGTFNYTVTTTGPCINPTANGTITVTADGTVTLTSGAGTDNQTICANTPIVNITYAVGGSGTGGSVSGLPTGVTGSFAAGVISISGTPTVGGTFNYTVTTTGPCVTPSAAGTITVNPLPVITPTIVQPTTCVSLDGSITLVISGAAGPFTFAWTGPGVNPSSQNQTGLAVGNYSVTVTDAITGCFASANFALLGPGGCSICPTIPTVTANPSPVCKDSTVTLTASGLTDMGITYGIEFKYSLTNIPDPYTGGTSIGTVANGSLTGGGTIATLNTIFPVAGNYIIYAILSPTPLDPFCRPKDSVLLTVNPTPTAIATPASQTICSAGTITTIVLSGTGTTFNWTRDNTVTVTGIAASGSGNIGGSLTNTTNAPITVTFTITPTASGCPGTPINATVLVNPTPNAVATPPSQTICSGATITTIVLSGAVTGTTFNWTRDNTVTVTGIAASGSGNISGALTNTTNAPITVTFTITPTANSCPGTPITATVLVNPTPNAVATPPSQTVCSGVPMTTIVLSGAVTGTTYNWTRDNQVNVTGIPNSGSGNISGTPINNTVVAQTVTFTITPTANGCPGTPITATMIVNKAPVITCPANITVNNTPGQCGAIVNYPPATATGAPAPVITYSQASGTFFRVGTTTVTCTATNSCGTVSCTFTITVIDNQPPVITCPGNIIANNNPGLCSAVVTYPLPTVTDNCCLPGAISLTQTASQTPVAGSVACNAGGFHTNNSYWRAYDLSTICLSGPLTINSVQFGIELADANGTGTTQPVTVNVYTSAGPFPGSPRTLVASQLFNVPDQTLSVFNAVLTTPPTVAVNSILVLELFTPDGRAPANNRFFIGSNTSAQTGPSYLSAADCGFPNPTDLAIIGFPNMHIILNANGVSAGANPITQIAGLPSGSAFPVGVTTNTFRATDASGNTATCSFTVTVIDNQAPAITCPAPITVTTPVGSCTAIVTYVVTATDNCPGVTTTLVSGLASGSAFPVGVNTVTWRATDAAGNISTCSFTVTVNDGQLPVITGQPVNRTVCVGTNAVFSVTATNAVSYQWQAWNGTAWVNISGTNASTLTLNAVTFSMNTNSYRVIINGLCTSNIISNVATLYVNPLPTISLLASGPLALLPAQSVTITAVVSPGGGSYQWFKDGIAIAGATGASLTGLTVDDIGSYTCRYTDLNGCVSTSSAMVVTGLPSGQFWVYPNPNDGLFHVRFYNQGGEEVTVIVYNALGQLIHRQKTITSPTPYTDIPVDLGGRNAAGTYIVELRDAGGRLVGAKKIIVYDR